MDPEQYRRATALFERLRELPAEQASQELDSVCEGDPGLRSQVLRLLAAERAIEDDFLAGTAVVQAARLIAAATPGPGAVIGNYRLGARIGAGGMGVVYEAQDLRLQRRVALKILPLDVSPEARESIQRFRREALAASALNHPNIVSIFEADFDQGYYFIAMEFVEGKTLRELAAPSAPRLDNKTILEILAQIASALTAAHQAGIIHRDIKPENVMVRPDGFVKVLDFGLAKLIESPAATSQVSELHTRPGRVAGTIQYVSPEQVLGKPAGPQTDLFSLGVVAYELSTGIRPFDGPTDGAVFDAIVNRSLAAPSSHRPALEELDPLILRALEKDPDFRFQSAKDLCSAIRLLQRGSQTSIPARTASIRVHRYWPFVAAVLAAALIAFYLIRPKPEPLPVHFERMTYGEGEEIFPNLFPDGKQFLYASSARGHWDIYLQRAGGTTAINLTADSPVDNSEPALSPDASRIAFRSERDGGGLFLMEATGENPRRISARGHLPAWSPDGRALAYCDDTYIMPNDRGAQTSRIHILDLASNTDRVLETGDAVQPSWSPHGERIAYWGVRAGGNREIFTIDLKGGAPVLVTNHPAVDVNAVWAPNGRMLYFTSDRGGTMNLWRVAIDERTGRTQGQPEPVTTPAVYLRYISWSADGSRFLYSQSVNRIALASMGFDPARLTTTGQPTPAGGSFNIANFSISPDETQIVHDTVGDPTEDLWVVNIDGSGRRKLIDDNFRNRLPSWSPDGKEVLFISSRTGIYQEWIVRADGSGLRQLTSSPQSVNAGVWLPGGRYVLASLFQFGLSLLDTAAPLPIVSTPTVPGVAPAAGSYAFVAPPDNGLAIGYLNGTGENPILYYSLAEKKLVPLGIEGARPNWIPGTQNRYLVFFREDTCYLYDRQLKKETRLFTTPHEQLYFLQLGPKGHRLYFSRTIRDAHLWMGEMPQAAAPQTSTIEKRP